MTTADLKMALIGLVTEVAYADSWLPHTEAFANACAALGYRFTAQDGLLDGNGVPVPKPAEKSP